MKQSRRDATQEVASSAVSDRHPRNDEPTVIASVAKQSRASDGGCFVVDLRPPPRNDDPDKHHDERRLRLTRHSSDAILRRATTGLEWRARGAAVLIKTQQKMEDGRNIIYYSFVDEDDDDGEAAASPEVIGESEDDS